MTSREFRRELPSRRYDGDELALFQRLGCCYRHARSEVMVDLERAALGCDYGGTSWTTRREADRIAAMLDLRPGKRLLDIGSGSGWPALYWAGTTGCAVVLTDVPLNGLRVAAERAEEDDVAASCWVLAADAAALPFADAAFHAITHSDVLCCLRPKAAVLAACQPLIRADGAMAFTVISIAPGLSASDRRRAIESGPPFVEAAADYPSMLRDGGWRVAERRDLTVDYQAAVLCLLSQEEARRDELVDLLGREEYADRLVRRRRAADAIAAGLLRRELFRAVPGP